MLHPIFIVLLVTLSMLHSGDSDGLNSPQRRYATSLPRRNRLGITGNPAQQPQSSKSTYIPNNLIPGFTNDSTQNCVGAFCSGKMPNLPPGVFMISLDKDGNPLSPIPEGYSYVGRGPNLTGGTTDVIDRMEQEKRREEENDPNSHKINTKGETIRQPLPSGGGDIVIKISGTNINQRKMNQLREYMKKSIGFVFENTMSKSAIMARYM